MALLTDEQVLELWRGMTANTTAKGSAGASDRAALSRAVGLEWYGPAAGRGRKEDASERFGKVASRLERALARVERSARHDLVTDAEEDAEEAAADGGSWGDAPKMQDHVPVAPGQGEAAETPPPPRVGQDHPAEPDGGDLGGE